MSSVRITRTQRPITVDSTGVVVHAPRVTRSSVLRDATPIRVAAPRSGVNVAATPPAPITVSRVITGVPGASGGDVVPYAIEVDDVGGGVSYVGRADPGSATSAAVWQIQRLTLTGSDVSVEWASGNAEFSHVWDDRLGLSYT